MALGPASSRSTATVPASRDLSPGPASGRAPTGTWFGVSFSEPQLRALALRCGLEARYLEGAETQYLWAWFFKP